MAYEENLRSLTLNADASLGFYTGVPGQPGSAVPNAGMQFRFVRITGKDQVGLATAATQVVCGILQNKPQVPGAAATIGYEGISVVVAGGPIAAGDLVAPDATGRGVTDNTNGRWQAVGIAAGAGELVSIFKVR
jgi:hypothetical protein